MFMRGDMFGQSLPRPETYLRFSEGVHGWQRTREPDFRCRAQRSGPIWPGRLDLAGTNLGDVWQHPLRAI